ncbi:hypothetical protein K439DRAFT_1408716 [Ramaria rubella]|nr:hypothetical protein K439DRAFT_1408716 [Ramaria rubella]
MAQEIQLTITPCTLSTLPPEPALIAAGKALFETLDSWKQGKTFSSSSGATPYKVKTSSRPKQPGDGAAWHLRYSEHKEGSFDEFWEGLGRNKAVKEKEFIPELNKVTLLKTISPTEMIWTLYYKFPPPISPRVFTALQVTHLEGGDDGKPREGWIVSLPVDVSEDADMKSKEEKGVRGKYVSVERIKEGKEGIVEWAMATSSTPGGNIPQFIAETSMPGQIYKDVPHFLEWLKKNRVASTEQAPAAST